MKKARTSSSIEIDFTNHIQQFLHHIGEDSSRDGLKGTPARVVRSWQDLFKGYSQKVEDVLTLFDSEHYDEMIALTDIEFYSTCEHHLLPFFGKAHLGYLPNGKIVGISKLARIVEIFSRRLQNQERLTQQIADAINTHIKPKGVIVVIEAKHFCMIARGVAKQKSSMSTCKIIGEFRNRNNNARSEFFALLRKGE